METEKVEQVDPKEQVREILKSSNPVSTRDFLQELDRTYQTILGDDRFKNWQEASDTIDPERPTKRLEYGSMVLFVATSKNETGNGESEIFKTSIIKNLDAENKPLPSKPGEKDLIYLAAKELMQDQVDDTKKPTNYELWTENPVMIKWAMGEGKDIFEWDEEVLANDTEGNVSQIKCNKRFNPTGESTESQSPN